jgi:hypothetical protein
MYATVHVTAVRQQLPEDATASGSCSERLREAPAYAVAVWAGRHGAHAAWFHAAWFVLSLLVFSPLFYYHGLAASTVFGVPESLTCRNVFWYLTAVDGSCGTNGIDCQPFSTEWFPIRCPSRCSWPDSSLVIWGDNVGGYRFVHTISVTNNTPPPQQQNISSSASIHLPIARPILHPSRVYLHRGNSRVCVAATHAGLVSPTWGGCVLMKLNGPRLGFNASLANGVLSRADPRWFPSSLLFRALPADGSVHCGELGWAILIVGFVWFIVLFVVIQPTRSYLLGWCLIWGFWYVALASRANVDMTKAIVACTASVFLLAVAGIWMVHVFMVGHRPFPSSCVCSYTRGVCFRCCRVYHFMLFHVRM